MDQIETLDKITEYMSIMRSYQAKIAVLVAKLHADALTGQPALSAPRSAPKRVRSLQAWADHLSEHGPTARSELKELTGYSLTKTAYDQTVAWTAPMAYTPDEAMPDDTVLHVQGLPTGVGRPAVIYFLWSQRWDVNPRFGVGGVKPAKLPESIAMSEPTETDRSFQWAEPRDDDSWPAAATVQPDGNWPEPKHLAPAVTVTTTLVEPKPATLTEWDDLHAPLFDDIVRSGRKPTDEQMSRLRSTCPEGADPNAAIAMAHRAAVKRSQQPQAMTGVIRPEEQPVAHPDFSGFEVVGNHNHVPHAYGPLCKVSNCTPTGNRA